MRRLKSAALVGFAAVLSRGTAHADEPTFHVTGRVTLAYSDNILGAPDKPPPSRPDIAPPVADFGLQFAPGVALLYVRSRAQLAVTYAHPMLLYFEHPLANASGDQVRFLGRFTPTAFDELTTNAVVERVTSSLGNLTRRSGPGATVPAGDETVVNLIVAQTYARALTPMWSLNGTGNVGVGVPLEGSTGILSGGLSVGPEFALERHRFGIAPTLQYARPLSFDDGAGGDQLIAGGEARWGWDWTENWSSNWSGGVVAPVDSAMGQRVRPVGAAAVYFQALGGYTAALAYARGYAPNLITGQYFFSDTTTFHAGLPVYRPYSLEVRADAAFGLNRVVDFESGAADESAKTTTLDLVFGWFPKRSPHVSLRYQYTRQFGAPEDQVLLPNLDRHLGALTVEYIWPPRTLVVATGGSHRVDRTDQPIEEFVDDEPAPRAPAREP